MPTSTTRLSVTGHGQCVFICHRSVWVSKHPRVTEDYDYLLGSNFHPSFLGQLYIQRSYLWGICLCAKHCRWKHPQGEPGETWQILNSLTSSHLCVIILSPHIYMEQPLALLIVRLLKCCPWPEICWIALQEWEDRLETSSLYSDLHNYRMSDLRFKDSKLYLQKNKAPSFLCTNPLESHKYTHSWAAGSALYATLF